MPSSRFHFILIIVLIESSVPVDSTCSENQFLCTDGKCITNDWVCDGARDCQDGSDEHHEACDRHLNKNSSCFGNQPECKKHGLTRCIPHEWLCDGHPDCDAGEDELNCTVIEWFRQPESLMHKYQKESLVVLISQNRSAKDCGKMEFRCKGSLKCITSSSLCDKVKDCEDGSDEVDCPESSTKGSTKSISKELESTTSPIPRRSFAPTSSRILATTTLSLLKGSILSNPPNSTSNRPPSTTLSVIITTTPSTSTSTSKPTTHITTVKAPSSSERTEKHENRQKEPTVSRKSLEENVNGVDTQGTTTPSSLTIKLANLISKTNFFSTRSSLETVTRFSEIPRTVRYIKGVPIEPVNYVNSSYVVVPEED